MLRVSQTWTRANAVHQCRRGPFRRGVAYSSKVRAFPFKVSPEEANTELSKHALLPRTFFAIFSPPLKPTKLVPVYFPAWLVDAEIEAKVTLSNASESLEGYATAFFINSYLPGYLLDDLSITSFLTKSLTPDTTVPFSAELETQFDTAINCLPFRTSPFSVLNSAQSLSVEQCRVTEDLRIHPETIHTHLIGAYPVLIPLYLAQYEGEASGVLPKHVTAILQAHCDKGPILWGKRNELLDIDLPFLPKAQDESFQATVTKYRGFFSSAINGLTSQDEDLPTPFMSSRGAPGRFANIASLIIPPGWPMWGQDRIDSIKSWLHRFVGTGTFQTTRDVNMDDPRIRPFTSDELHVARRFMAFGMKRAEAHALRDILAKVQATEPHDDLTDRLDLSREKATPSWWKEWQKSNDNK
ncbi:hypothetical protein C8R46DRAFT_400900 [Mycena filopes]|nr:hypothetical protein C8R46DRAFT_400900 [Mycena filopes]